MTKKPNYHMFIPTIISMGCLLMTGCGQQGALYLPKPEQQTNIPTQEVHNQEAKSQTNASQISHSQSIDEQQLKQMEQQILDNPNDY